MININLFHRLIKKAEAEATANEGRVSAGENVDFSSGSANAWREIPSLLKEEVEKLNPETNWSIGRDCMGGHREFFVNGKKIGVLYPGDFVALEEVLNGGPTAIFKLFDEYQLLCRRIADIKDAVEDLKPLYP